MTIRRYGLKPPTIAGRLTPPRPGEDETVYLRRLEGELDAIMQEVQRFLRYLQDANDTSQSGLGIVGVSGTGIDHGALLGLLDDDHTQYLKEKASGGLASEIPIHHHVDPADAGTVDHGTLTGLADDDHTQYLTTSRHEALDSLRPRHPLPHTHTYDTLIGTPAAAPAADEGRVALHRHVHTHLQEDIVNPTTTAPAVDEGRIALHRHPHVHEGADLIGAVTVETVGSPASPLSLGDFILASQIFGP